jgi:hypothetical protein
LQPCRDGKVFLRTGKGFPTRPKKSLCPLEKYISRLEILKPRLEMNFSSTSNEFKVHVGKTFLPGKKIFFDTR